MKKRNVFKRICDTICIWFHTRRYKKMVKRSIKRHPKAYEPTGWEFNNFDKNESEWGDK